MGSSTTFTTAPSTMENIVKYKPQVDGLPIFEKDKCGQPHCVHRSKSALFVACGELNASSRVGIALSIRELW